MEGSAQTSYHLVLASKHFRAYELMKKVMHRVSTGHVEGAGEEGEQEDQQAEEQERHWWVVQVVAEALALV